MLHTRILRTNIENRKVEDFWDRNLCGSHFITHDYLSPEFFESYRRFRYQKTHHLDEYIDWQSAINKDVLEVGLGIGADATRWAQYAKSYTGIDLSTEAVKATQKHFDLLGLRGNIHKDDVENLSLPDDAFDLVYSYGVLHHTSNITNGLKEIHRVLRKNGKVIIMLYSKSSINYWMRIQVYLRLRFLMEYLKSKAGLRLSRTWQLHLKEFNKHGWSYWSWNNFPHHCTDGPECKIANIYCLKEIKKMLHESGFRIQETTKAHFPLGGRFPKFERLIAKYVGFHQIVWAQKS